MGRTRAVSVDVLARRLPAPVSPEIAQFYHLRDQALRIQQQLAAHDRQAAAVRPHGLTPKEAGYPAPFLTPEEQARRKQEARAREQLVQRLLAQANQAIKYCYLPSFLVPRPESTQTHPSTVLLPLGSSELFMPISFWHSQYRKTPPWFKSTFVKGRKGKPGYWTTFDHWRDCCNECRNLIKKQLGKTPENKIQVVEELNGENVLNKAGAAEGYQLLDRYMALHKPVMIGVSFKLGRTYNRDKTTEHFVVLVGAGVEKGRKYYRFFDVGTLHVKKGTNSKFKLFYNPQTGFCMGEGILGTYTLSQIRY